MVEHQIHVRLPGLGRGNEDDAVDRTVGGGGGGGGARSVGQMITEVGTELEVTTSTIPVNITPTVMPGLV